MIQYINRVLSKFICWGICAVYYTPFLCILINPLNLGDVTFIFISSHF